MKKLLFLSHCVPNPPNKGEKIRSYHELTYLSARYEVHLVCFARADEEVEAAQQLKDRCASVFVEPLAPRRALMRSAIRFAFGSCLNAAFFWSARMKAHVDWLARRVPFDVTLAYSTVMAPYAPAQVPVLLEMMDVDSEKWLQYAQSRRPGFLFALEARRLRRMEISFTKAARCTVLTTDNERCLLSSFVPGAETTYMENGVDGEFFDGVARPLPPGFEGRRFVAFVGTMDYPPNIQAACSFAAGIFPELRNRDAGLEFFIIGRNPAKEVLKLAKLAGVTVTGGVPDIRPFLSHARAIVVPLHLARGIQNKVLESLAMGRQAFASVEVCRTFGSDLPPGVVCCASAEEFVERVSAACNAEPHSEAAIRAEACRRFSWSRNLRIITDRLDAITSGRHPGSPMLYEETLNGT